MQFKKGDAHILAAVAGGMTNATLPIEVQVVGYSLLTDLVGCLGFRQCLTAGKWQAWFAKAPP
jgi:hypothetical protein